MGFYTCLQLYRARLLGPLFRSKRAKKLIQAARSGNIQQNITLLVAATGCVTNARDSRTFLLALRMFSEEELAANTGFCAAFKHGPLRRLLLPGNFGHLANRSSFLFSRPWLTGDASDTQSRDCSHRLPLFHHRFQQSHPVGCSQSHAACAGAAPNSENSNTSPHSTSVNAPTDVIVPHSDGSITHSQNGNTLPFFPAPPLLPLPPP